ncbi:MAG: response regulator transcription factor [Sphingomonas sp.]|uniref:LuxR C-terminal-related transcriptional regulator n=1 Tax=Sphingomonas sp. TaxID=28214 RepID=UPI001B1F1DCE|nr:LuxR C-terminal-related transcriptional regulator [Sphingomonas sp.]MBO9623910.1 response regulator transcription factor [Sphingomonas sp.]
MIVDACEHPGSRVGRRTPDVVVLQDPHHVPNLGWLTSQLGVIAAHWNDAHVLVLGSQNTSTLGICLDARVRAHLPRESAPVQVIAAIRLAMSGLSLYPASQLDQIGALVRANSARVGSAVAATAAHLRARPAGLKLTARQLDVLRLLVTGLAKKEVAKSLSISEGAVQVHVRSILKRIGASNRLQSMDRSHPSG